MFNYKRLILKNYNNKYRYIYLSNRICDINNIKKPSSFLFNVKWNKNYTKYNLNLIKEYYN